MKPCEGDRAAGRILAQPRPLPQDAMGWYCWLGVEVDDIKAWGNSQAIQLVDPLEAADPRGQGRNL